MTTKQPTDSAMKSTAETPPQKTDDIVKIRRYAVICAVLWTLMLSGLFAVYLVDTRKTVHEIGHSMVQAAYEENVLFRRWASLHGGVYVPETTATPANPYLAGIPERDIITPSGRRLTLLNPAYMTRQIFELAHEQPNMPQGHITSLNPIRAENAADPWERLALKLLEQGAKEVVEPAVINGQPHIRFMRPLVTEKPCLKCHAAQGYKDGDMRGGISATLSLFPIQKHMNNEILQRALIDSFIWLVGLGLIWFGTGKIIRTMTLLHDEHNSLRESRVNLKATLDATADGILAVSAEGKILFFSKRFTELWRIPQAILDTNDDDKLLSHVLDQLSDTETFLKEVKRLYGSDESSFDNIELKDGRLFERYSFVLRQAASMTPGRVWSFRDITERKKAEMEREAALAKVKKLEGIIPICMYCKNIRDDKDAWHSLETYMSEHTDALFSHGVCSTCMEKHFPVNNK
jgi:chemotaxis family two-component system sensor kinase Cph1